MDQPLTGKLLLVGEGDFSFAVSLLNRCKCSGQEVVASSLESEESIKKHYQALTNIQTLREKGVTVCFEVDATELQNYPGLNGVQFSRIIFNFPHAGGKSNHKKNRSLLNNFFQSAVLVLAPEGQIFVTLCKGQGGTPDDQPVRAWHDSWQVVSMAANSSLILTATVPFLTADYPEYNCVGFRSLDKGFNTENAITHVFELAESLQVPDPDDIGHGIIQLGNKAFISSPYLEQKVNRKLLYMACHPLCILRSRIEHCLSESFDCHLCYPEDLPVFLPESKSWVQQIDQSQLDACIETPADFSLSLPCCLPYVIHEAKQYQTGDILDKPEKDVKTPQFDRFCMCSGISSTQTCSSKNCNQNSCYHLRTSLLEQLSSLTLVGQKDSRHVVASGNVYGHCKIHNGLMPVRHEMIVMNSLHGENSCVASFVKRVCESLDLATNKEVTVHLLQTPCRLHIKEFGDIVCSRHLQMSTELNQPTVGYVWERVSTEENIANVSVVLLDFEKMVQPLFDIPSLTMLWSKDPHFIRQFPEEGVISRFKTFSVHPMKYFHDMSFWENEECAFDEEQYCDVIREIAGDVVTRVALIDRYYDSDSNRWSRCYRLTFQSHDLSVSYIASWKLQSVLRLEVAKKMLVTLR